MNIHKSSNIKIKLSKILTQNLCIRCCGFVVICVLMIVTNMEIKVQAQEDVSGYMRVDTDSLGTQFWFGATHTLGGLDISSDVYLVGTTGEFDIGPSFVVGSASLLPMAGVVLDYGTTNVTSLVAPQLFTIVDLGTPSLYFESWIQFFFNSPFDEGADDSFYTRNFFLYSLNETIGLGPQIEITYNFGDNSELASLAVGGRVNLNYGKDNTLGVFLGYETEKAENTDGITGRMTFVRNW